MGTKKWRTTHGYVVLAIPDSGLFVKDGQLVTGHGTSMSWSEMVLFSRREDADKHAARTAANWTNGDANGHAWEFPVIAVLVEERDGN